MLVGHSGVGKSTLVNALVPEADRATGQVNDVTGRGGRHTSTSAIALELPDPGGWVIDTPGVRSFGLAHVDPSASSFTSPTSRPAPMDVRAGAPMMRRSALDDFVARGGAGPSGLSRLESLRRLLRARNPQSSD